jgi:hypothetical protein
MMTRLIALAIGIVVPLSLTAAPSPDAETTSKATTPQRPPADRTPSRPGEAQKVTFEDLNLNMQADVVYRPFMLTEQVKNLEGKKISLVGYMHPGQAQKVSEFILLKNTQCKFGPGGQADHLTDVHLRDGQSTKFTPSPVKVEGTLVIEPFTGPDGNTWSLYRLENAQIR